MAGPDDPYDDLDRRARDRADDSRGRRGDEFGPAPSRRTGMHPALLVGLIVGALSLLCGVPVCIGLLVPAVQSVRNAANRAKSSNNMKQIALGMHEYDTVNGLLPNNSYGPDGKPLLSWRVHLLPHLEQEPLYRQFKLDEPWDSPKNIRLLDRMPAVYAVPRAKDGPAGTKTYYRGFSSPGAIFERRRPDGRAPVWDGGAPGKGMQVMQPFGLASVRDRPNETILLVEAGEPVEWTKPDDLDASPGKPLPRLGGLNWARNRVNVAFVDGSVRAIRGDLPDATLRALVTHGGGETPSPGWDR
jgi:prepilin-type processing-associated H-X9-DG protein